MPHKEGKCKTCDTYYYHKGLFICGYCKTCAEGHIKDLEKIADFAYDLHTKDHLNIKKKWGVSGVQAEKLLTDMIEKGVLK